jgi:Uma2 family endonuclease
LGSIPISAVSGETPIYYRNVLLNPKLIVEVLSEKTEDYDRGEKFENYKLIESFTDYLLVDFCRRKIEHFEKDEKNRWRQRVYQAQDEIVSIESMKVIISLNEIYEFESR